MHNGKAEPLQETLLAFPCEFTFKAMLKNTPQAEHHVAQIVGQYAIICENGISSKISTKKNYTSISCTANLQDENQLKKIYAELKNHPDVLMTL